MKENSPDATARIARPSTAIYQLDDRFYDRVEAAEFPQHILRFRNDCAAKSIGLKTLSDAEWIAHFGRFEPIEGTLQQPLALRYHGHQFRSYNPHLGDGRGFLFAQFFQVSTGRLLDLGTKGTGQTPWSRSGDGRLTLKGAVRELLAAELLQARGVPTCKILSIVETGEALQRHDEPSPTRAAALVRLSHSHIRFGAFQRLAYHDDQEGIQQLGRYCAKHFYPDLIDADAPALFEGLLEHCVDRMATTCAGWMAAGYVHGVLNTDNMNITGESFDYGPWRFLPYVDQMFTAAYFDHGRLYAYARQPGAVLWNLARLAECFLPWMSTERASAILDRFTPLALDRWAQHFLRLLGVASCNPAQDEHTLATTMQYLETRQVPYDQFLFDWHGGVHAKDRAMQSPNAHLYTGEDFDAFWDVLQSHPPLEAPVIDPAYFTEGIAASCHIDVVENLWRAIDERDDWEPLYQHILRLRNSRVHMPGHNP